MGVAPNGASSISTATDVAFTSSPVTGQILQYDPIGKWKNKNVLATRSQTSTTTTAANGEFVLCSAANNAITVTLPLASDVKAGGTVRVMKTDPPTNAVTVKPASGALNGVTVPAGTLVATSSKTANYTAVSLDSVQASASGGGFTVTLPAPSNGAYVRVTKTDSSVNGVVVVPPSGTIDGDASFVANRQNVGQNFVADGSAWHYLGELSFVATKQFVSQDFMTDGTTWYMV